MPFEACSFSKLTNDSCIDLLCVTHVHGCCVGV